MTEAVFWALIAMLDLGTAGADDAAIQPVVIELSQMSVNEIKEFDDILSSKLFALDTRDHAAEIGEGSFTEGEYFSVDLFLYARCAAVASGQTVYETAVSDPGAFPKNLEFESILYIAATAYEMKTGENYEHIAKPSYETYSNTDGWR